MHTLIRMTLAGLVLLAAPATAHAERTAWKISAVAHESTWDWRETSAACVSEDPVVLAEQGTKTLLSLTPAQARVRARRLKGGVFFSSEGPYGVVAGRGRAHVRATQLVQRCRVTGYDETANPEFGPDGAPVTGTCDEIVQSRFEILVLRPREGRIGRSVGVRLAEDIGAEPRCALPSGFGVLGPEALSPPLRPLRVALRRFFGRRTRLELEQTYGRTQPTGSDTIVGTATTTGAATLRRIVRDVTCGLPKTAPKVLKRRFVCSSS